jgi:hypothetical protein
VKIIIIIIKIHSLFKQKCCKVIARIKASEEEKQFMRSCRREDEEGKQAEQPA